MTDKNNQPIIYRTNFSFLAKDTTYQTKDVEGNVVEIPIKDNGGYVIFYASAIKKLANRHISINAGTLAVLMCFADNLTYNSNVVKLTQKDIATQTGLSRQTICTAINDLKQLRLIESKSSSEYVINHNFLFKGKILQFYEDYKKLYPDEEGETF